MSNFSVLLILFLSILNLLSVHGYSNNFKVTDFGAVADGNTDNKQAFLNAWNKACATHGGVVTVPSGTYLVSAADFVGPCTGQTWFELDGTIVASSDPVITGVDFWIRFSKVDGLTITGSGTFDGNGANSWATCNGVNKCNQLPPTTLKISFVTNSIIKGLNFVNSKFFHVDILDSQHVKVLYIHITAPGDSPNTDGIHIGRSNDVQIFNAQIATGDDCISMGAGNTNINMTYIKCGPGHGISIGSLGKYNGETDVSGITLTNCNFSNTQNGVRIKTWAQSVSSPVVSGVTFANINMNNVKKPINIDQYYCPNQSCGSGGESGVQIKNVKFKNIRGTSTTATSVFIQCSGSNPCQDVQLSGLDLTYNGQSTNASCSNAGDVSFQGSNQVPSSCS